jgi:CelD/BcsL family acetyltransferase involved in cellulose biosynthesis
MSLRVVLHRQIPEDAKLHRQWNGVVLQVERPEVFYTYEWAMAMQSAYQASLTPLLFLAYQGDHLVGVASLATDVAGSSVSFLAGTTGDYCEFLSPPNLRAEFVDAVFAELGSMKLRFIALASLPEESATLPALRHAAGKNGFHVFIRPACLCAEVELGSEVQRQELKAALTGYRKFRRYINAMQREAPVTFVHVQSQEEIHAALPAFTEAHVTRFRETQRTSFLSTPERRLFLKELATRFSGTGVVTLSMLKIADRPVAWNYGFQFQGSWFIYQATFDSCQEEHSPGHCLLSKIVADACDIEGMKRIDLGVGAEGYKGRFGNSTRQTLHATATKSWRRHLQEAVRYRTASALKQSPKIESAVRRMLGRPQTSRASTPGTKKHLD